MSKELGGFAARDRGSRRGDFRDSRLIPFFTVPCRALHSRICLSGHACCMYARSPIRAPGAQVLRAADDCLSLGGPNVYAGMSRHSGFGHYSRVGLGRCSSVETIAAFAAASAHGVGSLLTDWKRLHMAPCSDSTRGLQLRHSPTSGCWAYQLRDTSHAHADVA